jgi:predicted SprT family Zn-dependent metalloprotease
MHVAGGWTEGEYVECLRAHGRDFRQISRQLNMRTESTAKHFYYKNRQRLGLEQVCVCAVSVLAVTLRSL